MALPAGGQSTKKKRRSARRKATPAAPALSGKFLPGGADEPMRRLADAVAAAGIKHITGSVIGDATGFDDQRIPEGWLSRYLGASYAARVSALSLNENLVAVAITPTSP